MTVIPNEVIVSAKFWKDEEQKKVLEEYLGALKHSKVTITFPERGEKKALVELAEKNAKADVQDAALHELQEKLLLPSVPRVIECFDISNLSYEHIVAGMTQWVDGKPNKAGYRKFKIQSVEGNNDDFASMREVVLRRYTLLSAENQPLPNLIIIDGGPGQLNSACDVLKELGLQIPIISLAKKEEEIYLPEQAEPLRFDKHSRMMLLIRGIRDSVHNFAISYNKKRRQMKFRDEIKRK